MRLRGTLYKNEREIQRAGREGGRVERRTELHGGDRADVPAREVRAEGGGRVEHCAREWVRAKGQTIRSWWVRRRTAIRVGDGADVP